ncbi:MAG TPA: hypothetical protein VGM81_21660 [Burkholderiaceae bacterium]
MNPLLDVYIVANPQRWFPVNLFPFNHLNSSEVSDVAALSYMYSMRTNYQHRLVDDASAPEAAQQGSPEDATNKHAPVVF